MKTTLKSAALIAMLAGSAFAGAPASEFRRIATMPVFFNTTPDTQTVCEIISATADGTLLIYTDSAGNQIGFVDIADPTNPMADGVVALDGEPTSVTVRGEYAFVGVNTSPDFVNPSGQFVVVDIPTRTIVRTIEVGGQPDSVAVSPDGQYAAVVLENERDEDLGDGEPPQLPGGDLIVVDLTGAPMDWTTTLVEFDGIPTLFPNDPEPEFVDINSQNIAVVTLQENNHLILVDLASKTIVNHFEAGTVDLDLIDTVEDGLIMQTDSLSGVPREPDAVHWISDTAFATADEGDLFGGSRGFTIFDAATGTPIFEAGNSLEHLTARIGHYPEDRSENKGNEPEGIEFGDYGPDGRFLFVGSERSSVVFVYSMDGNTPNYRQVLPSGVGPEGLLAIPSRGLFVTASEEDERGDGIRSVVSIYQLQAPDRVEAAPAYPTVVSEDRPNGTPIPWAALSGLSADPTSEATVYTIYDSYYQRSRLFTMDISQTPAVITAETEIVDADGVLASLLNDLKASLPGTDDFDPAAIINKDGSVNLDPEGIAATLDGYWFASEGAGNLVNGVSNPDNQPFASPNLLIKTDLNGVITEAVSLPIDLVQNQLRFGFEGVTVVGDHVYVAFQRAWGSAGDPSDRCRIGRYNLNDGTWAFAHYPLDTPASPNGGWVGLSEITWLGGDDFVVIERDNQAGTDAAIKRLYRFSVDGVNFVESGTLDLISKTLVRDHLIEGDLTAAGGSVLEKLEGLAVLLDGTTLIVNDNDGVDGSNGETQLLRLPGLFELDCLGDVTGDGKVDLRDLNAVLADFAPNTGSGDANGDGVTDGLDLNIVLANFGKVCK